MQRIAGSPRVPDFYQLGTFHFRPRLSTILRSASSSLATGLIEQGIDPGSAFPLAVTARASPGEARG